MSEVPKVAVGDIIESRSTRRSASIAGTVASIGRVNYKIKCQIRFAPNGPWFHQEHKVEKSEVALIIRNGEIIYKEPKRL